MITESNESICYEIATKENLNPSKCGVRVIRRDPQTGDPLKALFFTPNGQIVYETAPMPLFGHVQSYFWKRTT